MATPTPMKHAPSQQGRTPGTAASGATPPVSTPFSASQQHAQHNSAFSPLGPRSSPQTAFKKASPANSATLMGRVASGSGVPGSGSGGGGGGGSSSNVASAANYDSPAAAAMGALGLDLGGGLDAVSVTGGGGGGGGLTHLGAVAAAGGGRSSDDDERARRLQTVLEMLKQSKGRVSEAGLERLAKSMGLECLWEEGMAGGTGVGGGSSGPKTRTLIVAGSALALEIGVANNIVQSVALTFPESRSIVLRHVERADAILLDNLRLAPGESPLTKTLDAFAANLAQLAALDRLSVEPGLNLYEAVAGVYEALDRLYRWDLQKVGEERQQRLASEDQDPNADLDPETTVQCARHGRPVMHERGRLGLTLEYWRQRRRVRPLGAATRAYADAQETTWGLHVGCAPMGALVYQPVRVSDKWLSDAVEKPDDGLLSGGGDGAAGPDLDWLEPENTILPSNSGDAKTEAGIEGGQAGGEAAGAAPSLAGAKLPDVKFQAAFCPPLAVPFSVWHQLYDVVGLVPETEALVTFDSLSFPIPPGSRHDPSEPRTISCDKTVYVRPGSGAGDDNGGGGGGGGVAPRTTTETPTTKKHRHTLFIYKPVYGRVMAELPFAHPGQLVRMLPVLRQYAFLATLLESGFDTKMAHVLPPPPVAPPASKSNKNHSTTKTVVTSTVEDEFEKFTMDSGDGRGRRRQQKTHGTNGSAPNARKRRPGEAITPSDGGGGDDDEPVTFLDVVLTAHPVPRLQVVFPFRGGTADVMLEIGPNAQVHVVSQNLFDDEMQEDEDEDEGHVGKGKGRRLTGQDLGRMLEVCEDLGIWCEWIRSRCS